MSPEKLNHSREMKQKDFRDISRRVGLLIELRNNVGIGLMRTGKHTVDASECPHCKTNEKKKKKR